MIRSAAGSYIAAVAGVAAITALTVFWLPLLGLTSAALLFLLPVLLAAARGGLGPGLVAATLGALAYNFFLLPPRFTLRVHGFENAISVAVLFTVAFVTSRLATALKAREADARMRAEANAEAAALSALQGRSGPDQDIADGLAFLADRYGEVRILAHEEMREDEPGFSTLDFSAAAWAMHNGDVTGHGTEIMPAADWSFLPLAPRRQQGSDLAAVARPADGSTRSEMELIHLQGLVRLLGQARDRQTLEIERHARERLEDRDALRRTLLASLAHDFRTPLTVISGELVRLGLTDTGAAHALAEARRLDRMMDDLIGATRIESGALAPRFEATDLVDVVAAARAALVESLAPLSVAQQVDSNLPLIDSDPALLRHILINLLENAGRHARTSVTISAQLLDGKVELLVQDDGPGVPPEDRVHIFERFTRLEGSDRRGGSGLGLAIVKGFADAMGMQVGVDDAPGGGACFRLLLRTREVGGA